MLVFPVTPPCFGCNVGSQQQLFRTMSFFQPLQLLVGDLIKGVPANNNRTCSVVVFSSLLFVLSVLLRDVT